MNVIDDVVHDIKMAFVLFANAFLGQPPVYKPTRKHQPFRVVTGWRGFVARNEQQMN
jgi:hypothetical protein